MCRATRVTGDGIGGSGGLDGYRCCRFIIYLSLIVIFVALLVGVGCQSCHSICEICNLENPMLSSGHCGDVCMIGCSDCTESTIESMTDMSLGLR